MALSNQAKQVGKLNINQAELKAIMMILIIPLISVFISMLQDYIQTEIWDWTPLLNIIAWVIAPSGLAWLKSKYDTERDEEKARKDAEITFLRDEMIKKDKERQNEIDGLKDKVQSLFLSNELKSQEINFLRNGLNPAK